jgi:glycosyltransferase involved in cell wall biosynthesis
VEWLVDFDAFLATNFLPPATARPERIVTVVHDLAFLRFPETAPHIDARWHRRFAETVRSVAAVVVPSGSVREDLLAAEPVDPDRVLVVHHGVEAEAFAPVPQSAVDGVRKKFGIEGPYALFVGGIEPRKNLVNLVRGFGELKAGPSLVIAGGPVRWFPRAVEELEAAVEALPSPVRERVVRTGYVGERDKVALLSGASLLAYPSLYEGFGFPVLEAFAAGVPVLTSNVSSLPEVAGDAAVLVDPADSSAIGEGLAEMFGDPDLRAVLSAGGVARAANFTWEMTARRTADALHMAVRGPG